MPFLRDFCRAGSWGQTGLGAGDQSTQGTTRSSTQEVLEAPGTRHAHRTFAVGILAHFDTFEPCARRSASTAPGKSSAAGGRQLRSIRAEVDAGLGRPVARGVHVCDQAERLGRVHEAAGPHGPVRLLLDAAHRARVLPPLNPALERGLADPLVHSEAPVRRCGATDEHDHDHPEPHVRAHGCPERRASGAARAAADRCRDNVGLGARPGVGHVHRGRRLARDALGGLLLRRGNGRSAAGSGPVSSLSLGLSGLGASVNGAFTSPSGARRGRRLPMLSAAIRAARRAGASSAGRRTHSSVRRRSASTIEEPSQRHHVDDAEPDGDRRAHGEHHVILAHSSTEARLSYAHGSSPSSSLRTIGRPPLAVASTASVHAACRATPGRVNPIGARRGGGPPGPGPGWGLAPWVSRY